MASSLRRRRLLLVFYGLDPAVHGRAVAAGGHLARVLDLAELHHWRGWTEEAQAALNKALAAGDERAHALAARYKGGG